MRLLLYLAISAAPLIFLSADALAEGRRPSVRIAVDSTMADIVTEPQGHSSNVIFLNRCEGGCTITPGYDDSRRNRSSVVSSTLGGTAFISEFAHSAAAWQELVECVTEIYAPFDIEITDVDPGNQSHFEAIVAGRDSEINIRAGGVAPTTCGVINNAISFSFANQGSLSTLCWTVAQETAHAFGLDHEFLCADPMTYLSSCGPDKSFQDVDAPCGEDSARRCSCGASTQNSYRFLLNHFGASEAMPPTAQIIRPKEGAEVSSEFGIEVAAQDDREVTAVEFLIDGIVIAEVNAPPWVANAPKGLNGSLRVEARAYDNSGEQSPLVGVNVTLKEKEGDKDVVPGSEDMGAFGGVCEGNSDCDSQLCGIDEEGLGSCTQVCDPEAQESACPVGSSCIEAGASGVCWGTGQGQDVQGNCGCNSTTNLGSLLNGVLLFLGIIALRRRRHWGRL